MKELVIDLEAEKKEILKIANQLYKNLEDPATIIEIRKIIHPPIWKPAGSIKNFGSGPLSPRNSLPYVNISSPIPNN